MRRWTDIDRQLCELWWDNFENCRSSLCSNLIKNVFFITFSSFSVSFILDSRFKNHNHNSSSINNSKRETVGRCGVSNFSSTLYYQSEILTTNTDYWLDVKWLVCLVSLVNVMTNKLIFLFVYILFNKWLLCE